MGLEFIGMPTFQLTDTSTTREEIRKLHGAGMTVREIAKRLDLSTQGVHYHLKKLGINTARRP